MLERYATIKYFEEIFGFILLGIIIVVALLLYVIARILWKISEWKEQRRKKRERKEDPDGT